MYQETNDILYRAAYVWRNLTEYSYIFTYGYKKKLYHIHLNFSLEDFPHLAGFQYLNDLNLPKHNPQKAVDRILSGEIKYKDIKKGIKYQKMVRPRLEALVCLKEILENDFTLFSYMPSVYPFSTKITADYLISSHLDLTSFIFILQTSEKGEAKCNYLCCSAFVQENRNYETNQRSRTLLKKERIQISSNIKTILFDKITL